MSKQLQKDLDRLAAPETVYDAHEILPGNYVGISREMYDAYRRLAEFAKHIWEKSEGL